MRRGRQISVAAVVAVVAAAGCSNDGASSSGSSAPHSGSSATSAALPPGVMSPAEQRRLDLCGLMPRTALRKAYPTLVVGVPTPMGPDACGVTLQGRAAWVELKRSFAEVPSTEVGSAASAAGIPIYQKRAVGSSTVYARDCAVPANPLYGPVVVGPQGVVLDVTFQIVGQDSSDPQGVEACRAQVALAELVAERLKDPPQRSWQAGSLSAMDVCGVLRGVDVGGRA